MWFFFFKDEERFNNNLIKVFFKFWEGLVDCVEGNYSFFFYVDLVVFY